MNHFGTSLQNTLKLICVASSGCRSLPGQLSGLAPAAATSSLTLSGIVCFQNLPRTFDLLLQPF